MALTVLKHTKQAGGAIFISDRADFTARKVIRDKERHYIVIKGSILQEDITILNCMCLTIEHQNMEGKN